MKEKILYLSHIDWKWIKQRPQFVADELKKYFEVYVLYMFQNRNRKSLQKRSAGKENVFPIFTIPLAGRFAFTHKINIKFMSAQLSRHIRRFKGDYVYITHPLVSEFLPESFGGKIIYDCMDDHVALCVKGTEERVQKLEEALIKKADFVLVSSENLRDKLVKRYGDEQKAKMSIIRNGYNGEILSTVSQKSKGNGTFTLSYIGTIGKWFNFDFIKRSLEDFPTLRYKIIGPLDAEAPTHEKIEYTGTIEHHRLYDAIKDTDALMMPFVVNEIVESVDPVKLYEYINYNMNILCVRYKEVERFEPFVHFYTDYESYKAQIEKMMADNTLKYDEKQRETFLAESSWSARAETIESIIHNDAKEDV